MYTTSKASVDICAKNTWGEGGARGRMAKHVRYAFKYLYSSIHVKFTMYLNINIRTRVPLRDYAGLWNLGGCRRLKRGYLTQQQAFVRSSYSSTCTSYVNIMFVCHPTNEQKVIELSGTKSAAASSCDKSKPMWRTWRLPQTNIPPYHPPKNDHSLP